MANKIKTDSVALYLNTGNRSDAQNALTYLKWAVKYKRIRKQTSFDIKYDVETDEDRWINEDSPSTTIRNYKMSFDGELVAHSGDEIFNYLDLIRRHMKKDVDAESALLILYKYTSSGTTYKADIFPVSIQINGFSGEGGGGNATISYTLSQCGDPYHTLVTPNSGYGIDSIDDTAITI